jgi:hypothetical protein
MANTWYYSQANQPRGPVTWEALTDLARDGSLRPADKVWREGTADWVAARSVAGLFDHAPRRSPPAYSRGQPERGRRAEGSSKGLIIGLSIGIGGLLIAGIVVLIVVLSHSSGARPGAPAPPGGGAVLFEVDLRQDDLHEHRHLFRAGQRIDLWVDVLEGRDVDMDLFVEDPMNNEVASAPIRGGGFSLGFNAPVDGMYTIGLDNLTPGRVRVRVTLR